MTGANFHAQLPHPSHLIQFPKFKTCILVRHKNINRYVSLTRGEQKKPSSAAVTHDGKQRDRC